MKKLEGKELYRRLQEARNAKRLLHSQKQVNTHLKELIEKQAACIEEMKKERLLDKKLIEKQALRIEYLEKIVFGKRKERKEDSDDENTPSGARPKKEQRPRDSQSYQREIPKDITETKTYPLSCCPDCQGPLEKKKILERYLEDIVISEETKNPLKRVEKQMIESGWCERCRRRKNALPVNGSKVMLGENTKIMVVYLSVVMRMSYEQVKNMFRDIWHLKLSDGEIEHILEEQGRRLTPEHEKIAQALVEEAAHYDETGWKTRKGAEGNYCWIKTGTVSTNTLFLFGRSRGKGNAKFLSGQSVKPGITDNYPGYDGVFAIHALCWGHPNRKLRDLSESKTFTGKEKECTHSTYKAFKTLYKEIDGFPGTFEERKARKQEYEKRFREIVSMQDSDPEQLKIYKKTLESEEKKYFACVDIEGIPMDNNQAERRLRHVVLKRKMCLGSKTKKGAGMLEILYSVVLTWWWKDPTRFLSNYRHLLA